MQVIWRRRIGSARIGCVQTAKFDRMIWFWPYSTTLVWKCRISRIWLIPCRFVQNQPTPLVRGIDRKLSSTNHFFCQHFRHCPTSILRFGQNHPFSTSQLKYKLNQRKKKPLFNMSRRHICNILKILNSNNITYLLCLVTF